MHITLIYQSLLQLVPVSVRDVANPNKSFDVAVDADAMVDDLIELVVQHTGLHRDRVRLKLKAKDIRGVFQNFDLDNSGTVDYVSKIDELCS